MVTELKNDGESGGEWGEVDPAQREGRGACALSTEEEQVHGARRAREPSKQTGGTAGA